MSRNAKLALIFALLFVTTLVYSLFFARGMIVRFSLAAVTLWLLLEAILAWWADLDYKREVRQSA